MEARFFTDDELVAYLDGEGEYAPVDEIEIALQSDAALVQRLDALRIDTQRIAAEFEALLPKEPVVMSLPVTQSRSRMWTSIFAGAIAASLAIGFFVGTAQKDKRLQDWVGYVAAYQALYSTSTLAHIETTQELQQQELDRVAASIGKSIDVQNLSIFPDVDYRRSQILSYQGQALIQLAYLTSTGEPVALCIIRSNGSSDRAPVFSRMEGLSTSVWSQGGYEYILIGGQDDALIARMASALSGMLI